MANASKETLLKAGQKRGSGMSVHRSKPPRAHKRTRSPDNPSVVAADAPGIDELRQARSTFYSQKPEDRRKDMNKDTAQQGSWRRDLGPKPASSRGSKVKVHERHQKHYSDRRPHHRRTKEIDDADSTVYVYRYANDTKEEPDAAIPQPTRRASDSMVSSGRRERRRRAEKPKLDRPEPGRESLDRRKTSSGDAERRRSLYTTETVVRKIEMRSSAGDATNAGTQRPRVARTISMRETPSAPASRPALQRSQTTTRIVRQVPKAAPDSPSIDANIDRISSNNKRIERHTGFFGTLFGPRVVGPEANVQCLTCLSDDIPVSKSARLGCGHRMCHDCLKRVFTMSVTDPQHMPPKCCTADHIPLKHVDKLFSTAFKIKWNKKFHEYTTKNRIYCPAKGCGEWIKPANIYIDTSGGANGGRKFGKCARCKTKVCCTCNGKWHTSRECPKDEETKRFVEVAKSEGWQRCFNCSAMVELKEGCNHMTCRCRAEFCMICGLRWKSCDCPWFNYEAVENDRLQHMNVPQARRVHANGGGADLPLGYQEELERRREQEQRDEALAQRVQVLGLDDDVDDDDAVPTPRPARPPRQHRRNANHNNNNNDNNRRTQSEDDDGSFIDGRAPNDGSTIVLNHDFLRRAREIVTGNYADAEEAASRMMDELATAHAVDGIHIPRMPQFRAPPNPIPSPPLLRQHSAQSRRYNNLPQTRPSERVVPGRNFTDYGSEAARHRPATGVAGGTRPAAGVARRHSAMAGLTKRTASGRVDEWRRHVDVNGDVNAVPDTVVGG